MSPPKVAPVVEMEVTVELVVTVGAVAAIGEEPDNELVKIRKFPVSVVEL